MKRSARVFGDSWRTRFSGKLRAGLQPEDLKRAASGEICGSSPLPDVVTRSAWNSSRRIFLFQLFTVALDALDQRLAGRPEDSSPPNLPRCREPEQSCGVVRVGRSSPMAAMEIPLARNSWPIRADPTTLPSRSKRLPLRLVGEK